MKGFIICKYIYVYWEGNIPCIPEIVLSVRDIINRVTHKLKYRTMKAEIWRK